MLGKFQVTFCWIYGLTGVSPEYTASWKGYAAIDLTESEAKEKAKILNDREETISPGENYRSFNVRPMDW